MYNEEISVEQAIFTSYLDKAFRNKRLNYIRDTNRNTHLTTYIDDVLNDFISLSESNIYEDDFLENLNLIDVIGNKEVFNKVSQLNPKDYEILNLRLKDDKTFLEISNELCDDFSKIRNSYSSSMRKLKKVNKVNKEN